MSISINTNAISLSVQRSFNSASTKMNDAMEKMSTGYKINSASDDAAGYSVSQKMESIISTYSEAETNGQMGSSLLQTQEGVLEILHTYLQRIRDLSEQAANGTYATSSRMAIASEVSQRMSEVNRLCEVTDFNGLKLFDGSQTLGVNLQVGVNSGMENVITLNKSLFASAKVTALMNMTTNFGIASADLAQQATEDKTNGYIYKATDSAGANAIYCKSALAAELYHGGVMKVNGTNLEVDGAKGTITAVCNSVFVDDNSAREFLDRSEEHTSEL